MHGALYRHITRIMSDLTFIKMHGLGNDFVILDARMGAISVGVQQIQYLADRRFGIGCDQILIIEPASSDGADFYLRIFNADGGEIDACGNGTRCVAFLVMKEFGVKEVKIQTNAGILKSKLIDDGRVALDMGQAKFHWRDIPLAQKADTLALDLSFGVLSSPAVVNVGNPHAIFFVDNLESVALEEIGSEIENHAMFPERTNVEVAQILTNDSIRLKVWERGVGITQACGTGACATLVAASRRSLTSRSATVILDGGALDVEWKDDNHTVMIGPVETIFTGVIKL